MRTQLVAAAVAVPAPWAGTDISLCSWDSAGGESGTDPIGAPAAVMSRLVLREVPPVPDGDQLSAWSGPYRSAHRS